MLLILLYISRYLIFITCARFIIMYNFHYNQNSCYKKICNFIMIQISYAIQLVKPGRQFVFNKILYDIKLHCT